MTALALTDKQLALVLKAAEQIPHRWRGRYLEGICGLSIRTPTSCRRRREGGALLCRCALPPKHRGRQRVRRRDMHGTLQMKRVSAETLAYAVIVGVLLLAGFLQCGRL
jgi:hypothetical protein